MSQESQHPPAKLFVSLRGGNIEGVWSDADVQVVIHDWDDVEDGSDEARSFERSTASAVQRY